MKALVLADNHALALVERPRPVCEGVDDVLVRVRYTGICGTDRGVLVGKFHAVSGVIMGHETVGEVAEVGPGVTRLKPGNRVIVNPTLYCGCCEPCRRGQLNFCRNKAGNEIGIDRDGGFAEFIRIEERFLHLIPEDMDYERAVLVEPLACVLNNLDAAKLRPGDTVAILGGGPIGLVAALVADHFGCPTTLVETDDFRRQSAIDLFAGVDGCRVAVSDPGATADLRTRVVIDTVGSLLAEACRLAEDAGKVVIMGFNSRSEVVVRPLHILQRGLTIVGAGDYNSLIFPRAVELARQLPLERLISHRFPLDEHDAALRAIGVTPSTDGYMAVKVLIEGRMSAA